MPEPTGLDFDFDTPWRRVTYGKARASATAGRGEIRLTALQAEALVETHEALIGQAARSAAALDAVRKDRDRLLARAAAAEAAVQRVRDYVTTRNEELLDARDRVLNNGRTASPASGFERSASELRAVLPLLSAPPQPDLTTVSGIVNAAPDDQPVTVTGYIHYVEVRTNRAGAAYVELVLVDRAAEIEDSDPDTVTVVIPASVYAAMDLAMRPREGTLVEVTGRAVREVLVIASGVREACGQLSGGEPVYARLTEPAPTWLDWTELDEAAHTDSGAL